MPQFDPTIIHTHAERLYSTATLMVMSYTGLGLILGLSGGYGYATTIAAPDAELAAAIVGSLSAALGFFLGQTRAFTLRLAAQTALCQLQIETNTRTGVPTTTMADETTGSWSRPSTSQLEPSAKAR